MTDELPLPELGPEWTDHWRKKVHDQMRAYGDARAAAAVAKERERIAAQWEAAHGFDKHGVAAAIRGRG